jgi:hypothetical protein
MTTTLSAALRMPLAASVAAPAPPAPGLSAEPCAPKSAMLPSHRGHESGLGGIIAPAFAGRRGGTDVGDRFGGITRSGIGSGWYGQDQAQNAGGGPLRG